MKRVLIVPVVGILFLGVAFVAGYSVGNGHLPEARPRPRAVVQAERTASALPVPASAPETPVAIPMTKLESTIGPQEVRPKARRMEDMSREEFVTFRAEMRRRTMVEPLVKTVGLYEHQVEPFNRIIAKLLDDLEGLAACYPAMLVDRKDKSDAEIDAAMKEEIDRIKQEAESQLQVFLTPDQMRRFREGAPAKPQAHHD